MNRQEQESVDNRKRVLQKGDQLAADAGSDVGQYQGAYGSGYNESQQALSRLGATPGYTDEERQQIIREQQLQGLQNGYDPNSNFLTGDEFSSIYGDPNAAMRAYDPGTLSQLGVSSDANTRAAAGQTAGNLRSNVSQLGKELDQSVDRSKLGLSGDYAKGVSNVLNTSAGDIHKSLDPSKLGISSDYSDALQFTPQDEEDIVDAAGTSEGNRFAGEEQNLRQKAIEQGNTSPAALAAMQERLNLQEGSAAGDAMTDARIKAKQARMGAAQGLEATRLGAEQYLSGQGVQGAEYLGNLGASEVGQQEQMRLGTEEDIAGRQAQNALAKGQLGSQAEMFAGQQNLANENAIAGRDIGIEQGNQATGQKLLGAADQAASDRSASLAGNRQATEQGNQANTFNRGMQVQGQLAAGNKGVADQRIAGNAGYLAGQQHQQDMAQAGQTASRNTQLGTYNAENSGANQATQTGLAASQKPGLFDKIVGTAIGAAGAAGGLIRPKTSKADGGVVGVNGPEAAMVGENGPEMVVPADGMQRYGGGKMVTKPTIAILGENGPEAVIPFNRSGATKLSTNMLNSKGFRYRHPTSPVGPFGPIHNIDPLKAIQLKV